MENETQAEHIANRIVFSLHVFDINNLWSDVTWCSTTNKQIFLSIREFGQAKICNDTFPAVLRPEDQIFRFKISMHCFLGVHLSQSLQDRVDDFTNFVRFKSVFSFDFVIELASFQKFNNDVQGIFRFEDLVELHAAPMIEAAHDLYLFDETFFSFVLAICCFFRKCLYSKVFADLQLLCQIDRCEITLSDFLSGLELLVEASLVESALQHFSTHLKITFAFQRIVYFLVLLLESQSWRIDRKGILEIKVERHDMFFLWGDFYETVLVDIQCSFSVWGPGGRAGEEQFAWVVEGSGEHWCYDFH